VHCAGGALAGGTKQTTANLLVRVAKAYVASLGASERATQPQERRRRRRPDKQSGEISDDESLDLDDDEGGVAAAAGGYVAVPVAAATTTSAAAVRRGAAHGVGRDVEVEIDHSDWDE